MINTQFEILHLGDDDYGYIKVSTNGGSTWEIAKQIQGYSPTWTLLEINLDQWNDEEIQSQTYSCLCFLSLAEY